MTASHYQNMVYVPALPRWARIAQRPFLPNPLAFLQLHWRAFVASLMLAAFVLPTTVEAACYEAVESSQASAQVAAETGGASVDVSSQTPSPAKAPAGKAKHTAVCQHSHCCHAQAALDSPVEVGAVLVAGLVSRNWSASNFAPAVPIDGPERPPQA